MYTQTRAQIIEFIKKRPGTTVKDLVFELGITQAAVHRALNKLITSGHIEKQGTPPKVFYFMKAATADLPLIEISEDQQRILNDNYLYIDPTGRALEGLQGFLSWMRLTRNQQKPENCLADYLKTLKDANRFKNHLGLIDATERFGSIFENLSLDKIFYFDFYSLIKFGKTKAGQLLLHGKQAQDRKIIFTLSEQIKEPLNQLIKAEKIDALAWAPHSLPRKIPFLKELRKNLNLPLPTVDIVKSYPGAIPIAQKSLSKIEERIQNARETMLVPGGAIKFKNILLIDDAVGSGATMNEIGLKLKAKGAAKVIGFAIVGSYKGFEVIKEV